MSPKAIFYYGPYQAEEQAGTEAGRPLSSLSPVTVQSVWHLGPLLYPPRWRPSNIWDRWEASNYLLVHGSHAGQESQRNVDCWAVTSLHGATLNCTVLNNTALLCTEVHCSVQSCSGLGRALQQHT